MCDVRVTGELTWAHGDQFGVEFDLALTSSEVSPIEYLAKLIEGISPTSPGLEHARFNQVG
jgi:hypothetical protein